MLLFNPIVNPPEKFDTRVKLRYDDDFIYVGAELRETLPYAHVKGHNNHPENERCDYLANNAAKGSNLVNDIYYEKNIKGI